MTKFCSAIGADDIRSIREWFAEAQTANAYFESSSRSEFQVPSPYLTPSRFPAPSACFSALASWIQSGKDLIRTFVLATHTITMCAPGANLETPPRPADVRQTMNMAEIERLHALLHEEYSFPDTLSRTWWKEQWYTNNLRRELRSAYDHDLTRYLKAYDRRDDLVIHVQESGMQ